MDPARLPKKSETIEVRLSHEAETAFIERCRDDERTVSEAIRQFIDGQIHQCPAPWRRVSHLRVVVAAIVGAALGMGIAAPSLARTTQPTRTVFEQLDRNHDGVLSYEEFRAR